MRVTSRPRIAAVFLLAFFPPAHGSETAAPVETSTARSSAIIEQLDLNGTAVAVHRANVSAAVAGKVEHIEAAVGDAVQAGATLLRLDVELAELALQSERALVARAQAELENAARRLAEARELASDRSLAVSELRDREAAHSVAAAALQQAEAAAAEQQGILERHVLRAPFPGVIGERLVDIGEWVNPGDTVYELVATRPLFFDFRVPQRIFPKLDTGTKVTLHINALPDVEIAARIDAIVPVSDERARNFLVRAVADNLPDAVTPGMSARAILHIAEGRDGITVPRDAVLRHPDGRTTVWTITERDGMTVAQERNISPGLSFDSRIEIREGLDAGETVIVRGNEALQQDQVVRIINRAPEP